MYIYMGIVSARMNINAPANTPHILIRGGDLYPDIYVCIDRYEYLCIYVNGTVYSNLLFPAILGIPFPTNSWSVENICCL
jgi:hypothetical protein